MTCTHKSLYSFNVCTYVVLCVLVCYVIPFCTQNDTTNIDFGCLFNFKCLKFNNFHDFYK